MFFLTPTAHPNPQKKGTAAQVFKVTDGKFGLFQYAGETSKEDEARSRWQIYAHVETDLYPAITARTGHGYQPVKAFDPKRYDYYRELHHADSLAFYQGRPAPAKPPVKKKQSARPGAGNGAMRGGLQPQAVVIAGFSPDTITAGTFSLLTITGSGFGTPNPADSTYKPRVQFTNADNLTGYITTPLQNIISFTNTQIVVAVPSNDATLPGALGSSAATGLIQVRAANGGAFVASARRVIIPRAEITLNYAKPNGTTLRSQSFRQVRLTNRDGSGGIRFKYAANVLDARPRTPVPPVKAIETALRKWRCKTTLNLGDNPFQAVPLLG